MSRTYTSSSSSCAPYGPAASSYVLSRMSRCTSYTCTASSSCVPRRCALREVTETKFFWGTRRISMVSGRRCCLGSNLAHDIHRTAHCVREATKMVSVGFCLAGKQIGCLEFVDEFQRIFVTWPWRCLRSGTSDAHTRERNQFAGICVVHGKRTNYFYFDPNVNSDEARQYGPVCASRNTPSSVHCWKYVL